MQLASAVQTLTAVGLVYTVSYNTSNQPVGTVLEQRPSGGSTVKTGTKVDLTVVGTASTVTVPNVTGQSQAQADASLAAAGLNMRVVGPVANNHVPPGVVIAQSPADGATVTPRSVVSVTVSAG